VIRLSFGTERRDESFIEPLALRVRSEVSGFALRTAHLLHAKAGLSPQLKPRSGRGADFGSYHKQFGTANTNHIVWVPKYRFRPLRGKSLNL
jgi:hypothetical protein